MLVSHSSECHADSAPAIEICRSLDLSAKHMVGKDVHILVLTLPRLSGNDDE